VSFVHSLVLLHPFSPSLAITRSLACFFYLFTFSKLTSDTLLHQPIESF
jgi:hypothetical protein